MHAVYRRRVVAILQIRGIDEEFYARLKRTAAADSRSVSQEVLHFAKECMRRSESEDLDATSAKALLALAGSWEDDREADDVIRELKAGRRNSNRAPAL
jgi:plasmid stability protein